MLNTASLLQWNMSDEELVRQVLAGDVNAWAPLAHRHNQRIYRACRSIVSNAAEAEEALQDAFVRAYRQLSQFRGDIPFVTWLTKVAVFEALARRQPRPNLRPELVSKQRNAAGIEEAVDSLPPNLRTVFVLCRIQGLRVAETAACLLLDRETVDARLQHAERMLQKHISAPLSERDAAQVFLLKGTRSGELTDRMMEKISRRADQRYFAAGPQFTAR